MRSRPCLLLLLMFALALFPQGRGFADEGDGDEGRSRFRFELPAAARSLAASGGAALQGTVAGRPATLVFDAASRHHLHGSLTVAGRTVQLRGRIDSSDTDASLVASAKAAGERLSIHATYRASGLHGEALGTGSLRDLSGELAFDLADARPIRPRLNLLLRRTRRHLAGAGTVQVGGLISPVRVRGIMKSNDEVILRAVGSKVRFLGRGTIANDGYRIHWKALAPGLRLNGSDLVIAPFGAIKKLYAVSDSTGTWTFDAPGGAVSARILDSESGLPVVGAHGTLVTDGCRGLLVDPAAGYEPIFASLGSIDTQSTHRVDPWHANSTSPLLAKAGSTVDVAQDLFDSLGLLETTLYESDVRRDDLAEVLLQRLSEDYGLEATLQVDLAAGLTAADLGGGALVRVVDSVFKVLSARTIISDYILASEFPPETRFDVYITEFGFSGVLEYVHVFVIPRQLPPGSIVGTGAVSGTVRVDGTPQGDVRVTLHPHGGAWPDRSQFTDNNGRFQFGLIRPGTYTIAAVVAGYQLRTETVTVGDGANVSRNMSLSPLMDGDIRVSTSALAMSAEAHASATLSNRAPLSSMGWSITELPSWCIASPSIGVLLPGAEQTIRFSTSSRSARSGVATVRSTTTGQTVHIELTCLDTPPEPSPSGGSGTDAEPNEAPDIEFGDSSKATANYVWSFYHIRNFRDDIRIAYLDWDAGIYADDIVELELKLWSRDGMALDGGDISESDSDIWLTDDDDRTDLRADAGQITSNRWEFHVQADDSGSASIYLSVELEDGTWLDDIAMIRIAIEER